MKSIFFSLLLFCCFAAPVTTTFFVIGYQKKQVKKRIKKRIIAGIDQKELVFLKFTKAESEAKLNWKHEKEFEYEEEMYDVVATKCNGDTTYYWCWWDNEETKLNKRLDQLVSLTMENDLEDQEKNEKKLHHFFKSLYFSKVSGTKSFTFQISKDNFIFYQKAHQLYFHTPPSPPPEIV